MVHPNVLRNGIDPEIYSQLQKLWRYGDGTSDHVALRRRGTVQILRKRLRFLKRFKIKAG